MHRLIRSILVVCTALAAVVSASLQGNVLCYADDGRHIAVEVPHPSLGGHETDHHADGKTGPDHHSEEDGCTDVAGEFSGTPQSSRRLLDLQHVELTGLQMLLLAAFIADTDMPLVRIDGDGDPPPPPALAFLRTIVLLA